MPSMGRPLSSQERSFNDVSIAPRAVSNSKEMNAKEKERLLNKISGYQAKNDLYVDGKKHNKMGKDEFLKLLTHQLQNQDPMKPMEQGKMAAELAQFSQLEQLSNLNSKFDSLNQNAKVEDKFYGASFLGKEVVTSGRSLEFKGEGTDADVLFTLPKPASKALVRIYDKNKNMVGEIWKENLGRGNQNVTWDGTQLDGAISGAGEFSVNVLAWDDFAEPMEVQTKVKGQVDSVFFENGETVLLVDGKKVFLRDVDSFHSPGEKASAAAALNAHNGEATANPTAQSGSKAQAMAKLRELMAQNGAPQAGMNAAKNSPTNLPIAKNANSNVNLNRAPVDAYKANNRPVGTGITDVYDVD